MPENVLEKIIKNKKKKIEDSKKNISIGSLNELIEKNKMFINFKENIEKNIKENKFSIIAEIKKASPSAGVIIDDYDPVKIASIYHEISIKRGEVKTNEKFQKILNDETNIRYEIEKCELNHVAVSCSIVFLPNYETNGEPVIFQDMANATLENTHLIIIL